MITEILIATVIYVIFNFGFTYPWNIMIFKKDYDELAGEISREEPIIPLGVMAMVLEAFAMAVLFNMFFSSDAGLLDSLKSHTWLDYSVLFMVH